MLQQKTPSLEPLMTVINGEETWHQLEPLPRGTGQYTIKIIDMPDKEKHLYHDLRKPAKEACQESETSFQLSCAAWLKKELYNRNEPQVFYHVPNEGNHKVQYRAKQKLMGVLSGVSDVVLPLRSGEYSGVYCELKVKNGVPSKEQKDFLDNVSKEGYLAVVINDIETFKEVFEYYLDERQEQQTR